jgi:hypothetical protein
LTSRPLHLTTMLRIRRTSLPAVVVPITQCSATGRATLPSRCHGAQATSPRRLSADSANHFLCKSPRPREEHRDGTLAQVFGGDVDALSKARNTARGMLQEHRQITDPKEIGESWPRTVLPRPLTACRATLVGARRSGRLSEEQHRPSQGERRGTVRCVVAWCSVAGPLVEDLAAEMTVESRHSPQSNQSIQVQAADEAASSVGEPEAGCCGCSDHHSEPSTRA